MVMYRWLMAVVAMAALLATGAGRVAGQEIELELTPAPPGAAEDGDFDVLGRGPVHEAFAEQVNPDVEPGLLAPRVPPEPIDEMPPEMKPEGDDVIWVSGYWFWDEDRDDFVWVSGVWRRPPPGCRWVPGHWLSTPEGYQWVAGFWGPVDARELEYVEPPPASLDTGPTSPAPSADSFWVPGTWMHVSNAYRWRPGFWHGYRDGWTWVHSRYVWTPRGCIFVPGYWDYPLTRRGFLFAPVYFRTPVFRTAGYFYRPTYWVPHDALLLHLFVRPRSCHLYFGDYYAPIYRQRYFMPAYQFHMQYRGFASLYVYYEHHYRRHGIDYCGRVRDWHHYYSRHEHHRPPATFHRQVERAEVHRRERRPATEFVIQPYQPRPSDRIANQTIAAVPRERREQLHRESMELRKLAVERQRVERAPSGDRDSSSRLADGGAGRGDRLVLPEWSTPGRRPSVPVPDLPRLDRIADPRPPAGRSRDTTREPSGRVRSDLSAGDVIAPPRVPRTPPGGSVGGPGAPGGSPEGVIRPPRAPDRPAGDVIAPPRVPRTPPGGSVGGPGAPGGSPGSVIRPPRAPDRPAGDAIAPPRVPRTPPGGSVGGPGAPGGSPGSVIRPPRAPDRPAGDAIAPPRVPRTPPSGSVGGPGAPGGSPASAIRPPRAPDRPAGAAIAPPRVPRTPPGGSVGGSGAPGGSPASAIRPPRAPDRPAGAAIAPPRVPRTPPSGSVGGSGAPGRMPGLSSPGGSNVGRDSVSPSGAGRSRPPGGAREGGGAQSRRGPRGG